MIKTGPIHSGGGVCSDKTAVQAYYFRSQVFTGRQVVTLAYVLTNTILMFQSI
jgi:hypothetical protein